MFHEKLTSTNDLLLSLQALYEQQKKSHLCDLLLIVENVSFPVHKCVLAAFSGYFYTLFDKGKQTDNAGSKVRSKYCYCKCLEFAGTNSLILAVLVFGGFKGEL